MGVNPLKEALDRKYMPPPVSSVPAPDAPAHVAVCTPAQDMLHTDFHTSMLRLMWETARRGVGFHPIVTRDTILQRSRSIMARAALANKRTTHLLYVDSDMVFPPDAIHRLLARDLDIVGANYRTRHHQSPDEVGSVARSLDDQVVISTGATGTQEVLHTGTGFLMIKRHVFEEMARTVLADMDKPWFETTYRGGSKDDWMGEDVYFCVMARQAGFKVFVDHDLSQDVGHIGNFAFRWR